MLSSLLLPALPFTGLAAQLSDGQSSVQSSGVFSALSVHDADDGEDDLFGQSERHVVHLIDHALHSGGVYKVLLTLLPSLDWTECAPLMHPGGPHHESRILIIVWQVHADSEAAARDIFRMITRLQAEQRERKEKFDELRAQARRTGRVRKSVYALMTTL